MANRWDTTISKGGVRREDADLPEAEVLEDAVIIDEPVPIGEAEVLEDAVIIEIPTRRSKLAALAAGVGLRSPKGPARGRTANRGR